MALYFATTTQAATISAKPLFSMGTIGSAIELLQPQQIRYDRKSGEIYLCDTGHDRIIILDARGLYSFEFAHSEVLQSPTDVALDSQGRAYVLGSQSEGSYVHVFDYNGEYLRPLIFEDHADVGGFTISSLVIDGADQLYIMDGHECRILCFDLTGRFISQIPLMPQASPEDRRDQTLGSLSLYGDLFLVAMPMIRTVVCVGQDGGPVKAVGFPGGGYGELSFPIAAAMDGQGNTLVLDKHRCLIVSYDPQGKVNGEIGGMGNQPGWFYHPIAMVVDKQDRIWVAQGLNNLVQALQLPAPAEAPPTSTQTIVVDE
jgi:hypothetical protein